MDIEIYKKLSAPVNELIGFAESASHLNAHTDPDALIEWRNRLLYFAEKAAIAWDSLEIPQPASEDE